MTKTRLVSFVLGSLCVSGLAAAPAAAWASPAPRVAPLPESAFTRMPDGGETAPDATSADCPTGYTCWFGDGGYSGWIQRYADVQTANIAYPNQMSSWINRNSHAASWFTGSNGTGTGHCMETNTAVSQVTPSENDTMVSFKIYAASSC